MGSDVRRLEGLRCTTEGCKALDIDGNGRQVATPIAAPIDTDSEPLDPLGKKRFLTGCGMLGWLAQTVRCDVAYTYSRIAQHSAKPTKAAMQAVVRAFKYLYQTRTMALSAPYTAPDRNVANSTSTQEHEYPWRFFSDSDHAGNAEVQNRRRSQNGGMITLNGAPVLWMSKASSVAFACEAIGEAHADTSSASVEIYAAGNMTAEILAYSYVVDEMGLVMTKPYVLEIDNDAARIWIRGTAGKSKLKHIDCRQEWCLTLRSRDIIEPVHVDSESNLADICTKIHPPQVFVQLRDMMMVDIGFQSK